MYECDDCSHVKTCESAGAEEFDGNAEKCPDFKLKLTKMIKVSSKTLKRLKAITFRHETYDQIINLLLDWAFDKEEYHKRLQA